jgi:hypothetical protein
VNVSLLFPCPYGVLCLPFYSHKRRLGFYMCKYCYLSLICGRITASVLWRLVAMS